MDPSTPPYIEVDDKSRINDTTGVRKRSLRLTLKRGPVISDHSSADDLSSPVPMRKKRRMHQFSDSSEDEQNNNQSRKVWMINCDDSDSDNDFHKEDGMKDDDDLPMGIIQSRSSSGCQIVMTKWRPEAGRAPCLDQAPVFYPTDDEFQDTLKYIESIRPTAEPYGVCRVVPPKSWRPPCALRENSEDNLRFSTRVQKIHKLQVRDVTTKVSNSEKGRRGKRGKVSKSLKFNPVAVEDECVSHNQQEFFGFEPGPTFTINEFEQYAEELKGKYFRSQDNQAAIEPSIEMIEGEFWRIVETPTEQIEVLYGADVETNSFKSGFPKTKRSTELPCVRNYETSGWNLNNIARLRGSVLEFEEGEISGVVVPWLYIGMCFSSFCWHVEDHHLYSVNYMHWGSPKVWYGVPGSAAMKLETAMKKRLPKLFSEQPDLLHKLVTQLSPSILKEEGVPVYRVVQRAGEFVITFPRAYHAGFNCGFNCAEAVNVAPADWLPHGQCAIELYKEQHRKTSVSHDKLLLSAVKKAANMASVADSREQQLRVILSQALKARLELERTRRAFVSGLKTKKMDLQFDASDERECFECAYDLHLSAVGCECSPERYSCLEHAKNICGCSWSKRSALFRYDVSELDEFLRILEGRQAASMRSTKLKIFGPKQEHGFACTIPSLVQNLQQSGRCSIEERYARLFQLPDVSSLYKSEPEKPALLLERLSSGNDEEQQQRSGPRIAKVKRPNKSSNSVNVELLNVGRLVVRDGWYSEDAILPAGFKSRVKFYNYFDLPHTVYYTSEILDCDDGMPLFKVSMVGYPLERFVCSSLDMCWQAIQERVNTETKQLRNSGKSTSNLPPLKPPESLKGIEMFGFQVPSIIQAVEALDPKHLCHDYWNSKGSCSTTEIGGLHLIPPEEWRT